MFNLRLLFMLFVLFSALPAAAQQQVHVDTMRIYKTGSNSIWRMGDRVSHSRPHWTKRFEKRAGPNLIYRKNGSLYLRGSYQPRPDSSLQRHGSFEFYYPNGQVRDSGQYANDQRAGRWKHFAPDGTLLYEQDHGTLVRVYYSRNHDTLAIGTMQPKTENPGQEFFNLSEQEGPWEFRDTEGRCTCRGKLVSGTKHGRWRYYSYDGDQRSVKRKRYWKYVANYKYGFLQLCDWQ